MIDRARPLDLGQRRVVRICSPEDLIIPKAVSGRPQDTLDVASVIQRQRDKLDTGCIRRWLSLFAAETGDSGIVQRFEDAWQRESTA